MQNGYMTSKSEHPQNHNLQMDTTNITNERSQQQNNTKQNDVIISFLRAARSGDLSKVVEFLENGQITNINACNANGLNALHLAAKDGYVDIVVELLKRGIRLDNATKKGNTALHIASLAGQGEVIKQLIHYNANVNVQSLNGFTPLYMAAQENHDACVRFLLSKGANPSLATEDGFTPLAVAMQQCHDKVVAVLLESDVRGKVRLPALHIASKKNDVTEATILLQHESNPDIISKSGFTPLHIAAHYGNVDIAKLLIDNGADVNFTAKHNITPLHVACKWGKTNIMKLLLNENARIDATTRDGLTPLHCAARSGHVVVIEILLNHQAPLMSKTKNGLTALHMAAQGEHDNAARILLEHNAPVDEVTVDYLTALHVAAHCGHVRVAKLLLDSKADPNARALNGFTPLHIACKKNRIKVVELLLKHGGNISATTESGLTPLHVASFMGCMHIVIYLLQHYANPDAPTVRGETPLHLAARANQTDIIRILLRNGGQVDVRAREGQTPLHVASRLANIDIIMLMLQHGANVNATTKDNYTPLHIAAKEGQEEVAQILIENNPQLNALTKKGFSPLHLAAKYDKENVVALLLQKGFKVNCQGCNDVTPLHVAVHYDHPRVVQILLENGALPSLGARNGHSPLHISAKKNQMYIAKALLERGADCSVQSKSGFSPLHLAAQEGHMGMVQLLLQHGVDANVTSKNGLTPLHLAAQEDKMEVARLLLQYNANISECTKTGYTPLHFAAHYGQINMVKFLLENDANIEMTTNVGYTPLHQAAQQGHTMIINLLLRNKANPNAVTYNGQTALTIANSLGYVTAVESLRVVTESSITNSLTGVLEEKYEVVVPELMYEAFLSDSEEEGGDDHLDHQQYKYMATDDLKNFNDQDHQNYDTTIAMETDHVDNASFVSKESTNADVNEYIQLFQKHTPRSDNDTITKPPVHLGFLVSFMVDARGGSMRGCRHSGVRIIVPPRACAQPTRITCRYVKPQRVHYPPPLMEGEALISRILELSPVETKFLGPVILEVPHFGSMRDKEREIIILRSDNGESWNEHMLYDKDESVTEVLLESDLGLLENLCTNRIMRIVTRTFPNFFAVVSRTRQEVHAIGSDGGTVSSQAVPEVQAIFPPNALTKKIRVGLQAQPVDLNGCCKLLGQGVAVSPVVTVEPRRRKFHKPITLSIPAPKACTEGMVNSSYSGNSPTLRLLCSITGGQNRAIWEDVTGSTPLAFVKDSVTFTTTVSARFWLMDCRNIAEASRMASKLYSYMTLVPFTAKFVVFAKRLSVSEAKLSVFCMTDDKEDKTLEHQDNFIEVAKSPDVEVLEDQDIFIELGGNLVPILKIGEQLKIKFHAFRENRLSFMMHVKNSYEPLARLSFMNEPKSGPGETPKQPICTLTIKLGGQVYDCELNIKNDSIQSNNSINFLDLGPRQHLEINADYLNESENKCSKGDLIKRYGESPISNDETIPKAYMHLLDMCQLLENDWIPLAKELGVPETDIELINAEYVDDKTLTQRGMAMLRIWLLQQGNKATGNVLRQALNKIARTDIVNKCINSVQLVTDDVERTKGKKEIFHDYLEGITEYLNDANLTAQPNNVEIIEKTILKANVVKTATTTISDEQTREQQLYYQIVDEKGAKTPHPSPNINDIIMASDGDKAAQRKDFNINTIRRLAEEHTRQVLEEAQENI